MPLYAVTYDHPDEEGWRQHVGPHVVWLRERLDDGSLLASGPFPGEAVKAALLIMDAPDRQELDRIVASDPFAMADLIANLTIREWDPIFGTFNARSTMPLG